MPQKRTSTRATIERICPICGATFRVPPSRLKHGRGQTCSRSCQYTSIRDSVSVTCAKCGSLFTLQRSEYDERRTRDGDVFYCSRVCRNRQRNITSECPVCGIQFTRWQSNPKIHCSPACAYRSPERSEQARANIHAQWKNPETRSRLLDGIARRTSSEEWQSFPHFQRGPANPNYTGGKTKRREGMAQKEYRAWRRTVFQRDGYTCTVCGKHGGTLNAHHIKPWADYPELRFDVANGTTLCESCHESEHGLTRRPKTYTCVICGRPKPSGRQPRCRSCGAKTRGML